MYNVFIVDDEPFILEGMPYIIPWEDYGLEIVGEASDGDQALIALQQMHIDILITDITMPTMNGLELISRAREQFPEMKCIVLSGYDDFNYIKEGLQYGIENYLLKPIQVGELKQTLTRTVEKLDTRQRPESIPSNSLDILRDNILYRWVSNRIDTAELKSRALMLSFHIDYPYYRIAVIRPLKADHHPLAEDVMQDLYQISRYHAERSEGCQCFCDPEGDIIIISGSHDHMNHKANLQGTLDRCRSSVTAKHKGIQLYISLGRMELNHSNVPASYESAKKLQEYFLIYEHHEMMDEEFVQLDISNKRWDMDLQTYTKLLLGMERSKLDVFIDTWFNELQCSQVASPSQIRNSAVECILHTKQLMQNYPYSTDWMQDYKALFTGIFRIHTLDQMKEHVKRIAGAAMECIRMEDDGLSPVIKQVVKHVEAQYEREISLKTLAQTYNMHPVYLGRLFQRETGQLFSDYLNKYRIEAAKQLLADSQYKTNEIACKVGYIDPSYFYKQFKKYCGISPALFRDML
ncbi:hypothetical protein BVG16_10085 [Paenibacillus selenitireducens]|uniref:DNA-binding response regulator n=1 Tax=Paenibacillus selenitireducens TaxID=1324314 RepID=A0A1T2XI83_9BACL|nr:response regulator transcription factor [Paenibacillus selenitireducens]OPA79416.1 hypothetical protein BVG16_10085 [Paenibacillus selenitireducens]